MEVGYKGSKTSSRETSSATGNSATKTRCAHRRRQSHFAQAGRDGRCGQVGLADRHPAEKGKRAGHDPRRVLCPPGSRSGRHDQDAADKGYEVTANFMAVSRASEREVEQTLELIAATPVSTLVVVDSFGSLYAEQVEILVKKYLDYGKATGKEVGIHAQQPATRVCQHDRGDHPRGQSARRHDGRPGPRRGAIARWNC